MSVAQIKDVACISDNSSLPLMARKDKSGKTQTLADHLHHAAYYAAGIEPQYADIASMAAVLHDFGKAQRRFQRYLLNGEGNRGDVVHAWQGAFAVDDLSLPSGHKTSARLAKEILELIISSHHGDLPDCIGDAGMKIFFEDLSEKKEINGKYAYEEVKTHEIELDLDADERLRQSSIDVEGLVFRINQLKKSNGNLLSKDSVNFYLGLFVKYLYSRLVDADRLDAACFEKGGTYSEHVVDWQSLIDVFDHNMCSFNQDSEINRIRGVISGKCREAASRPTGIYRLAVPTGGGKTLASLNYALHHAAFQGKRRIIYVIPYLSITEQTSKTFKNMLNLDEESSVLLEHYSSAQGREFERGSANGQNEDNEGPVEHNRKLAAERWDSPIIVTTMVQFLETVMSSHGTDLRKFHNMADSVIIFDEIQSLTTNAINLFNEVVSFLSSVLNSTILLCSATQPLLEKTDRENLLLSDKPDLISGDLKLFNKLRRTNIVMPGDNMDKDCLEFAEAVLAHAREHGNCLAIVNLKREARDVFQHLHDLDAESEFKLVHLSTSMCGRHRTDALNRVMEMLATQKPVICVSTQLIEAGVDLSFACVVRAMTGLDSILQAAGRCNRNGESATPKDVFVYSIRGENLSMLPDIQTGKDITQQLAREHPGEDFLDEKIIDEYYRYFLKRQKHGAMDYPIDARNTAYDLLSTNLLGRGNYAHRSNAHSKYPYCFAQSFKTVGNSFHVIARGGHDVVVSYGRSSDLLDELSRRDWDARIRTLRKLQEYTVSLFDHDFKKLSEIGAIYLADDNFGVYALDTAHYDERYGVVVDRSQEGIFV